MGIEEYGEKDKLFVKNITTPIRILIGSDLDRTWDSKIIEIKFLREIIALITLN